jgi:hypothetical protein
MKTTIHIKVCACVLIALMSFSACKKFALLKSEDSESIIAGEDLKKQTIWEFLSQDNFHSSDLTKVGLYGKAIQHAGLKDLLNGEGNYTIIIPTETFLLNFIKGLGYQTIEETPPAILRDLLLNTITDTRVRSFDLNIAETKGFPTLSKDSIFFSRTATSASNYVLTINNSPSIISPSIAVRSQNLEFKNGVAHVSDNFTYYKPKLKASDVPDTSLVSIKSDTILVTKDSYMNNGSTTNKNTNFGSLAYMYVKFGTSDANLTRRAICQFPIVRPSFSERIGAVKVGLYVNRIDGAGSIAIVEDENIDWNEKTINWNNAPVPGTATLSDIALPASGGTFKWYNGEITTAYLNALQASKPFINIGISTRSSPLFGITTREVAPNRTPYIVLTSSPVSILTNPINTGITVSRSSGVSKISNKELQFQGTAPQNIFYTIASLPANGFLTINSLPVAIGTTFTQEQVNKGVVKYLFNGNGSTDSFTLEAKDFQGGFYSSILTVPVQISN